MLLQGVSAAPGFPGARPKGVRVGTGTSDQVRETTSKAKTTAEI